MKRLLSIIMTLVVALGLMATSIAVPAAAQDEGPMTPA